MEAVVKSFLAGMLAITLAGCGREVDNSPGAPSASTRPASAGAPTSPPPIATPEAETTERSTPVDRYVELDPADPLVFAYLGAAYASPPLTDDQKLSLLTKDGAPETDVFKRKDLQAQQMPAVNARLAMVKAETHYRIEAADLVVLERLRGQPHARWSYTASLGHYDTERHGFPIACLDEGNIGPNPVVSFDEPAKPTRQCFLPVTDEAVARRVEGALSRTPMLPVSATLYFTVVGPARRVPHSVSAELNRVHLKIHDPGTLVDPPALGEFDIDVPQPLIR